MYQLGAPLGFNLLNDFSGLKIYIISVILLLFALKLFCGDCIC